MTESFFAFWPLMGLMVSILFFVSVYLLVRCVRQKQRGPLLVAAGILLVTYVLLQCIFTFTSAQEHGRAVMAVTKSFVSLPPAFVVLLCLGLGALLFWLYRTLLMRARAEISPMSVKEAADGLSTGMCFYLTGGRVLLVNAAMEAFCRSATGDELISGTQLRENLFSGMLLPGCRREMLEGTLLLILADGRAWGVSERQILFQKEKISVLLANDVTELYQKTRSLQELRERLDTLNRRLTAYNQEIVATTAEKELLSARVRLHDEMGADLLAIRRYMEYGGSDSDRADIERRLRRNVGFLLTGQASQARDEYELMLETAQKLGVRVRLTGELPQTEPVKHVVATAIHECFTNTLRHAHGDELSISVETSGDRILVCFTNNGEPPASPVQEKGGLKSLRTLVEQIPDARMEIEVEPCYVVKLTLPKEVHRVV